MFTSGALQRVLSVIDVGPWESSSLFIKALNKGDDARDHGIKVPGGAYALFPTLAGIGKDDPAVEITTEWNDRGSWLPEQSTYWQSGQYLERRLTVPNRSELNQDVPRLLLVARAKTTGFYRCLIVLAGSPLWPDLLSLLRIDAFDEGAVRILDINSAGEDSSSFGELLDRLRAVNKLGWIPTVRSGDSGVGMTLEASLGIVPNASTGPDFMGIEIKSHRTAANSKKVTLFAKTPNWDPGGRVKLLDKHGYLDDNGRWSLYHSIYGHRQSSSGWQLRVDEGEGLLYVDRNGSPVVNWNLATLEQRLKEKHTETAFVSAETRGKGKDEADYRYRLSRYPSRIKPARLVERFGRASDRLPSERAERKHAEDITVRNDRNLGVPVLQH
jgi:hypothetical protein